jgi:hypothetical protein
MEEYNVMVKSDEIIGTTEYLTLYARCRVNRCRFKRVVLCFRISRRWPWVILRFGIWQRVVQKWYTKLKKESNSSIFATKQ